MKYRAALLASVTGIGAIALAGDIGPMILANAGDQSAILLQCEKHPNTAKMLCQTYQVSIRHEAANMCIITPGLLNTVEMNQVSDSVWTATESGGACHAVSTITLEQNKDKSSWTWTETRLRIDRGNKWCRVFNTLKPLVFETSADDAFSMRCERIKFAP